MNHNFNVVSNVQCMPHNIRMSARERNGKWLGSYYTQNHMHRHGQIEIEFLAQNTNKTE